MKAFVGEHQTNMVPISHFRPGVPPRLVAIDDQLSQLQEWRKPLWVRCIGAFCFEVFVCLREANRKTEQRHFWGPINP